MFSPCKYSMPVQSQWRAKAGAPERSGRYRWLRSLRLETSSHSPASEHVCAARMPDEAVRVSQTQAGQSWLGREKRMQQIWL